LGVQIGRAVKLEARIEPCRQNSAQKKKQRRGGVRHLLKRDTFHQFPIERKRKRARKRQKRI